MSKFNNYFVAMFLGCFFCISSCWAQPTFGTWIARNGSTQSPQDQQIVIATVEYPTTQFVTNHFPFVFDIYYADVDKFHIETHHDGRVTHWMPLPKTPK